MTDDALPLAVTWTPARVLVPSRRVETNADDGDSARRGELPRTTDATGGVPGREAFVVGAVDENGNLAIQPFDPSAKIGVGPAYNVRAYGDLGDSVASDSVAFARAIAAVYAAAGDSYGPGRGAVAEVPRGAYRLTQSLRVPRGNRPLWSPRGRRAAQWRWNGIMRRPA